MLERLSLADVWSAFVELRVRRPLVHNITNYVAMSISANVLLALGASPAMVHALQEIEDFVAISDTVVINIGTLSPPWVASMRKAAERARISGKPWVLDPSAAAPRLTALRSLANSPRCFPRLSAEMPVKS